MHGMTDMEVVIDSPSADVKHPCPVFMERAIVLSRVAGVEKRTGAPIELLKLDTSLYCLYCH